VRRGRPRADWVYRGFKYGLADPTLQEPFLSGTYYNPVSLAVGTAGANAQVLYDSRRYTNNHPVQAFDVAGNEARFNVASPARPDEQHRGALILGVDVLVNFHYTETTWTATSTCYAGLRIIVAPQDPEDGVALLPPNYSMWAQGPSEAHTLAHFANGRQNCWEHRMFKSGKTDENGMDLQVRQRVRFKRRLEQEEGLFLLTELHANSSPITGSGNFVNYWCRTLVSDTR